MNKEEFIEAISEKTKSSKVEVRKFLEGYIDVVTKTLQSGDNIQLVGFGSWSVGKREARKGINPRTREEINIPASKTVKFSAGKALKEAVNK